MEPNPPLPPVTVRLRSQWVSGTTTMNVFVDFQARDLDEALRLIRQAVPLGAPLFSQNLEEVPA